MSAVSRRPVSNRRYPGEMSECAPTVRTCTGGCGVTRRTVTAAAGALAVGLLAACSSDNGAGTAPDATPGSVLATVPLDEVPVGGGLLVPDVPLVITRPSETEVRAFSGVCTHEGCAVGDIDDRGIICPCHTSIFAIDDGSVVAGPAPEPLPALDAAIEAGQIVVTLPVG